MSRLNIFDLVSWNNLVITSISWLRYSRDGEIVAGLFLATLTQASKAFLNPMGAEKGGRLSRFQRMSEMSELTMVWHMIRQEN